MAQRTTRTNDPDGVKQKVIDAAFRAFTTRGYGETAVNDLKADAGVSGGAFSHHFPSKKALALAVIEAPVREAIEETWIEPVLSADTAAQGIGQVFDAVIAALEANGKVSGCPLNNLAMELSPQDDEMRAALGVLFTRWRAAIAQKLRQDRAAGLCGDLDPEAAAALVVAAYSGAMAMAKAEQGTRALRLCAAEVQGYLVVRS
ncbi:TetR/AcrR family transcriptional regulator [Nitratireductor soli]|uniref:TetR/AcrR family transcriptional regulator n=1 Tax=Nitratireductor soli TaxID=1670619 RepID=UPI00065E529D|nr:TetR/AcrR family transcriptional regulator [Nitratireductor soli]